MLTGTKNKRVFPPNTKSFKQSLSVLRAVLCLLFYASLTNSVFLFLSNPLSAQQLDYVGLEDGFSSGFVFDFMQSSEGFIYIGLHTGLNRYDGYEVKHYKHNPFDEYSISPEAVNNILEDRRGYIWVAMESGELDVLDPRTGRFYHLGSFGKQKNRHHKVIQTIFFDDKENLWVGTLSGKVYKLKIPEPFDLEGMSAAIPFSEMVDYEFEVGKNPNFDPLYEAERKPIRSFLQDQNKQLWMVTHDAQLFKIDIQKNEHQLFFQSKTLLLHEPRLLETPGGTLCFTTGLKWQKIEKGVVEEVEMDSSFKDAFFHGWDADGKLIYDIRFPKLSTSNCAVYRITEHELFTKKANPELLFKHTSPFLRRLEIDDSGLIWAKGDIGLVKFNPAEKLFRHYLKGASVYRLSVDNNNKLYVYQGAFSEQTGELTPITSVYPKLNIYKGREGRFKFSKKGIIWGINDYQYGNNKSIKVDNPFFQYDINTEEFFQYNILDYDNMGESGLFTFDREDRLWFVYTSKLFHVDMKDQSAKEYSIKRNGIVPEGMRNTCIYTDVFNDLWNGTVNGAYQTNTSKLPNEELTVSWYQNDPSNSSSLSHNSIKCFHDDPFEPEKYMWIGTAGGGLNRLNRQTKKAIHYTTLNSGIPDDVVYRIETDAKGHLWISTNNGLSRFDSKKEQFKNYTKEDGLQDLEFNTHGSCRLANGEMVFGGINGINIFNPDSTNMEGSSYIPPVRLTELRINNQKVQPYPIIDSTGFQLTQSIEYTKSIDLTYLQNTIRIGFSALDFTHKKQNQYRYRLTEGSEREKAANIDWVDLETENKIQFTSLNPGDYLFEVMGSNQDGVWNETPATLAFTIHPPFWKSNLAYLGYVALLLCLLLWASRFQSNRLKLRNQLAYEKATAERLLELDKLKTNFFSNVTHELRTPLTLILSPLAKILKSNELSNKNFTLLKLMQRNSENLLKLINEILDLNKLEAGRLELNEKPVPVYLLLQRLVSVFESYSERKEVTFSFEYKGSHHLQVQLDQSKFEKVVNNLLSNAIKFTPNKGDVKVLLEDKGHSLVLSVSDTGRGIHEDDLPHIFDRFYQTKSPDEISEGGTGIGLALVQEYAKLFGGSVTVKSKIGEGSAFVFSFPKKEVFKTLETEDVLAIDKILENKGESSLLAGNATNGLRKVTEELSEASALEIQSRKKLLIVEDNLQLRDYLRLLLCEQYQVSITNNGKEAVDWLEEQATKNEYPDLILSDVMMPVMNGFQFLEKIKQEQKFCSIPVVMLTAKAATEDKLKALRIGVDDYMVKPFLEEELLVRIENLLTNAQIKQEYYEETAEEDLPNEQNLQASKANETTAQKTSKPAPAISISPEELEWLAELEKVVLESLSDFDFTLDRLGPLIFLSPRQIRRRLKQLTGLTFSQYLREARFGEARRLLVSGEVTSVKGVAYEIGMRDVKYFSREFKKHFGKSPSAYLEG